MDVDSVVEEVRAVVAAQMILAGEDPAAVAAGEAILVAVGPALTRAGMALAEQAAIAVGAQLPDPIVEVVLSEGQPNLVVRGSVEHVAVNTDHLDARITVRLPEDLKGELEEAAANLGDSVNTFVVKALAGQATVRKRSSRSTFKGTIET